MSGQDIHDVGSDNNLVFVKNSFSDTGDGGNFSPIAFSVQEKTSGDDVPGLRMRFRFVCPECHTGQDVFLDMKPSFSSEKRKPSRFSCQHCLCCFITDMQDHIHEGDPWFCIRDDEMLMSFDGSSVVTPELDRFSRLENP